MPTTLHFIDNWPSLLGVNTWLSTLIYTVYCLSLCFSEETLKAVGLFYLVSMPAEVKYPTQGVNRQVPCRGLYASLNGKPSQPLLC